MTMDTGIRALQRARRDLDKTHKAACAALVEFDLLHDDPRQPAEDRLAARSLRAKTLELCEHIRAAMNAVPEAAGVRSQPEELPPLRTAAAMLRKYREGVVATSVRHGHPILAAMVIAIVFSCQLSVVRADTVEKVIDALIVIESSGRPSVIGDNGKAVGLLQLHPVAVREANRIAGERRWKLADRFCPAKSRAMARTTLVWHYRRGCTDPVELGCRWKFPYSKASAEYRAKVRTALERI